MSKVTIVLSSDNSSAADTLAEALRVSLDPEPADHVPTQPGMLRRGTPVGLVGESGDIEPGDRGVVVGFEGDGVGVHVAWESSPDATGLLWLQDVAVDVNDPTGQYHLALWLGDRLLQSMDDPQTQIVECGSVGWTLAGNGDGWTFVGDEAWAREHHGICVPGLRGCMDWSRAQAIRAIVMHVIACHPEHPALCNPWQDGGAS